MAESTERLWPSAAKNCHLVLVVRVKIVEHLAHAVQGLFEDLLRARNGRVNIEQEA